MGSGALARRRRLRFKRPTIVAAVALWPSQLTVIAVPSEQPRVDALAWGNTCHALGQAGGPFYSSSKNPHRFAGVRNGNVAGSNLVYVHVMQRTFAPLNSGSDWVPGDEIPWVCKECWVILAPPSVPRSEALQKLHEHLAEGHQQRDDVQSEEDEDDGGVLLLGDDEDDPQLRVSDDLPSKSRALSPAPIVAPPITPTEMAVELLSFELLPPGSWEIDDVIRYYHAQARNRPAVFRGRTLDFGRIQALKSLRPIKCYIGHELWEGYVVFEFSETKRVVLDCPVEGNAVYVISGDWKRLVELSKGHLRSKYRSQYTKIIHKGDWLDRVRSALSLW